MLRLLAIAVLFAIILPVHGQDKGSQASSDQAHTDSSPSQSDSPSGTATCVVKEEGTSIECRWPTEVSESKLRRLFSPENAPNIGLVVVGLLGILAAVRTLRAINRQADLMKLQTDQMRIQTGALQTSVGTALEQLRVMQIQVDATQAKEQAQIAISLSNLAITLVVNTQFPFSSLRLILENIGETRAYNLSAKCEAVAWEKDTAPPSKQMIDVGVPQIVRAGTPEESVPILIDPRFEGRTSIPSFFYIHIRGCVMYNDIFDPSRTRHTTFQYRREFRAGGHGREATSAVDWELYGPDNHSS